MIRVPCSRTLTRTVPMDDEILIIDDEKAESVHIKQGWKVLIVDDEPEVHRITKMTLAQFLFDNKPIELTHKECNLKKQVHNELKLLTKAYN